MKTNISKKVKQTINNFISPKFGDKYYFFRNNNDLTISIIFNSGIINQNDIKQLDELFLRFGYTIQAAYYPSSGPIIEVNIITEYDYWEKTSFDRYVDKRMKDPEFSFEFKKAKLELNKKPSKEKKAAKK